ncbi:MAG: right-handed parallel beta-helix repeat-containing protein, partial [Desulfobacterales bacterium]|nr:right-handed parallel beta-helix repeat-containing protein [Desulfobacterales bacterium]
MMVFRPIFKNMKFKMVGLLMLLMISGVQAHGADSTSPGALLFHATPTSIGLVWPITGDDNHNAECRIQYRIQGEDRWQPFIPLFRIDDNNVNALAGSILFLIPQTTYEINLILSDPDGGNENLVESVITRSLPQWPAGGREFHVVPGSGGGSGSLEDPFRGIYAAQNIAEPGDIFWVHAGTYPGEIEFSTPGEAGNYIVWKGAGDGETLVGKIRISADHIWLEGLTVRDSDYALLTYNAPEDVVITYNYFWDNHYGVYLNHGGSNWTITDNTIVGDQIPGACSGNGCYKGEGIELAHSSGHVVAYNTISYVADGISYPGTNCDIFGNELFDLADDGIELDYGYANNRAWQNRISNPKNNGISFQPMQGSPWYVLRNQVAAPLESALKLRSGGRALIAHNTMVGWSGAMASGSGYLNQFQCNNNLWITIQDRYCWEDTSVNGFIPFWEENVDYDGLDWGNFIYAFK